MPLLRGGISGTNGIYGTNFNRQIQTLIPPADIAKVKEIITGWGDDNYEIQDIIYEIETLEIRQLYEQQASKYTGRTKKLRQKLAANFNRSEKAIQYILYR